MKKHLKNFISIFLVISTLLSSSAIGLSNFDFSDLFLISAKAYEYKEGYYTYEISDKNEAIITDVDESISGDITIPSSLGGYPVTYIGKTAFLDCNSITRITIPNGVTTIGSGAFYGCSNLKSLSISASVSTLSYRTLMECTDLENITVNPSNKYFSSDNFGVLFDKNKTLLICYPVGNKRTSYTIPATVTQIASEAFYNCHNLTQFSVDSSNKNFTSDKSGVLFTKDMTGLSYYPAGNTSTNYTIPDGVTGIGENSFSCCNNLIEITMPKSVTFIMPNAFKKCNNLSKIYYKGTAAQWDNIHMFDGNGLIETLNIVFESSSNNIYNLGEETYSFENYTDGHAKKGHCFGMSATSSGYHLGILDVKDVGISSSSELYKLKENNTTHKNICYYQDIQGQYSKESIVAGGYHYKNYNILYTGFPWLPEPYNIKADWTEVVNYVKTHKYDNKGSLQIGFQCEGEGGHAVNFLRYEEVNGQPRIYAYDNNFPDIETYFYKDSNGKIRQAPECIFSGDIDCIALRSVSKYFELADDYDSTRFIYALKYYLSIDGATAYPMECGPENGEWIMYEIPEGVKKVTITPLVDNAEFIYLGEEHNFEKVDKFTTGTLTLATSENDSGVELKINKINIPNNLVVIKEPSVTYINYGDSIILHPEFTGAFPKGSTVHWSANNDHFNLVQENDNMTCTITPKSSGDTLITVRIISSDGEILTEDSIIMISKAGFFDKIIAFFKKLFGLTKTIPQVFNIAS